MKYGFGVDLGGTTVKLAFFNDTGAMLHKWEIPTNTAEGGKLVNLALLVVTGKNCVVMLFYNILAHGFTHNTESDKTYFHIITLLLNFFSSIA